LKNLKVIIFNIDIISQGLFLKKRTVNVSATVTSAGVLDHYETEKRIEKIGQEASMFNRKNAATAAIGSVSGEGLIEDPVAVENDFGIESMEGGQSPSAQADNNSLTFEYESHNSHLPNLFVTTGIQRGSASTGKRGLVSTSNKRGPASTGNMSGPDSTGNKRGPVSTGNMSGPDSTGNKRGPASTGKMTAPGSNGNKRGPASTAYMSAPDSNGNKRGPASTGYMSAPDSNGNKRGPASTGYMSGPANTCHMSAPAYTGNIYYGMTTDTGTANDEPLSSQSMEEEIISARCEEFSTNY
jgi:hypothetical protein